MANEKGGDIFLELVADVRDLQSGARSMSLRITSLSDTMSVAAETLAAMAGSMRELGGQMQGSERLYERLAKVLIVYRSQTDERFQELEQRVQELETTHR